MFALSGTIDVPLPSTPTDNPEGTGLNSSLLPLYENLSPEELEAYLAEMESDVRAADRDMLEIETLVRRGVTGAGRLGGQHLFALRPLSWCSHILADYETFKPRLEKLIKEHGEDVKLAHNLEKRVARLVERHVTQVSHLPYYKHRWS